MNSFLRGVVQRPVLVLMVFASLTVFGIWSLRQLPVDSLPKIEPPVVTVITVYPGASAPDVERKVTDPIERSLSSMSGLKRMSSVSKENVSLVTLEFEYGVNVDASMNEMRQFLDLSKNDLPSDALPPWAIRVSTSMMPTVILGVRAKKGDLRAYRDLIKDKLVSRIETIDGVASTMLLNAPTRRVLVEVDRQKLQSRELSLFRLIQILAAQNQSVPAGRMQLGDLDLPVSVPGDFRSLDAIRNTLVGFGAARPLAGAYRPDVPDPYYVALGQTYLHQVADVKLATQDRYTTAKVGEHETMWVIVFRRSGANTVEVANRIRESLASLQKVLPAGLDVIPLLDTSDMIRATVDNLTETVILGGVFVLVVVLLFLRKVRPSLIVAVSIPTSMIAVFMAMHLMAYTINGISLMALALTIGMVVDDSIVVLESITRHVEEGVPPMEAAVIGTREVAAAVTASTLTNIVIFAPLLLVKGFVGIILGQLAFMAIFTMAASLVTALMVTPTMAARMLKADDPTQTGPLRRLGRWSEAKFKAFERAYGALVAWSLRHWAVVLLLSLGILGVSAWRVLGLGVDFVMKDDYGVIQLTLELPEGTRLERTEEASDAVSRQLRKYREVQMTFYSAGTTEGSLLSVTGGKEGSNIANIYARLVPKDKRRASDQEIADRIRAFVARQYPKALLSVKMGNPIQTIFSGQEKPVTILVKGKNFAHLKQVAREVEARLKKVPGTKDVAAELLETKPDYRVVVDRDRAARLGLAAMAIGGTLRAALHGWKVTEYRAEDSPLELVVRLRPEDRKKPEDLEQLMIPTFAEKHLTVGDTIMHTGAPSYPLGQFAKVVPSRSPIEIRHLDRERVVRVGADYAGRALGDVARDVDQLIRAVPKPGGVTVEAGAEVEQQRKTFNDLMLVLIFSVLLVYMVMAAQYESLVDPFVIMFSVPFALTGMLLAFFVTGDKLSIPAFTGLIVLVGVVVKNAIVLVDYTNQLRDRGVAMADALRAAGERRLRPVLMTAAAAVMGMVPLAITTKEGAFMWAPLGKAVVGGLTFSTLVTLIIVPVMYARFEFLRRRKAPMEGGSAGQFQRAPDAAP